VLWPHVPAIGGKELLLTVESENTRAINQKIQIIPMTTKAPSLIDGQVEHVQ
jgi:hypothetical protein